MKNLPRPYHFAQRKQRGVALVVSLIILLLMTLIGLSIMNGNRFFEKNAANTRDKQRALQAAQDALLYGEWWLNYGGGNLNFVACPTTTVPTTLQVCSEDPGTNMTTISSLPWYSGYVPTSMKVQAAGNSTNGGVADSTSATSDILYSQSPGIYISCITCGTTLGTTGLTVYRITAIGYGGVGGANGTVAIVQSTFASSGATNPLPTNLTPTY